jgi:hypothetical protein
VEFCLTRCQVLLQSDNGVKRLYTRIFIRVVSRLKFKSLVFNCKEEFLSNASQTLGFVSPCIFIYSNELTFKNRAFYI